MSERVSELECVCVCVRVFLLCIFGVCRCACACVRACVCMRAWLPASMCGHDVNGHRGMIQVATRGCLYVAEVYNTYRIPQLTTKRSTYCRVTPTARLTMPMIKSGTTTF